MKKRATAISETLSTVRSSHEEAMKAQANSITAAHVSTMQQLQSDLTHAQAQLAAYQEQDKKLHGAIEKVCFCLCLVPAFPSIPLLFLWLCCSVCSHRDCILDWIVRTQVRDTFGAKLRQKLQLEQEAADDSVVHLIRHYQRSVRQLQSKLTAEQQRIAEAQHSLSNVRRSGANIKV